MDIIAYAPADAGYLLCPSCARNHAWDIYEQRYDCPYSGPDELLADPDLYTAVFDGAEADSIPTCDHCLEMIEGYTLTQEGRKEYLEQCLALDEAEGRHLNGIMDAGKATLDENGKFPKYAWPGGYEISYITRDNAHICADCANGWLYRLDPYCLDLDRDSAPIYWHVYYEGPTLYCDECNAEIESEYGDPDAEEEGAE